jgi:GDP-D-mannose dehydratase
LKKRLFVTGLSETNGPEDLCPERPDPVIHLASQSFDPEVFRDPAHTLDINVLCSTITLPPSIAPESPL